MKLCFIFYIGDNRPGRDIVNRQCGLFLVCKWTHRKLLRGGAAGVDLTQFFWSIPDGKG